jgi:hypothetical protein
MTQNYLYLATILTWPRPIFKEAERKIKPLMLYSVFVAQLVFKQFICVIDELENL